MLLSVIVPLHNEEKRLDDCVRSLVRHLYWKPYFSEIILVENGSSDSTYEKAMEWKFGLSWSTTPVVRVYQVHARSKALALQAGVAQARGDYIYTADCDLSTPPAEIDTFLHAMQAGQDMVIGSRRVPGADVTQSARRRIVGGVFSLLTRPLVPYKDTQCGFKMYTSMAARQLFFSLITTSLAYDVELLLEARHLGLRVREIPVRWVEDNTSRVRLVRDSWQMFQDVIRLWALYKADPLSAPFYSKG